MSPGIIRDVRLPHRWLGFVSILLLILIGVGLISAAVPDEANADSIASGYYDGDGDDAVVAPERLAVLVDMAFGARGVVLPERAPDALASPVETAIPPIVEQSPPPPLRSPPLAWPFHVVHRRAMSRGPRVAWQAPPSPDRST